MLPLTVAGGGLVGGWCSGLEIARKREFLAERERERERVPSAAPGVQARGVRFVYNLKAEVP